jgi:hypothetical protein
MPDLGHGEEQDDMGVKHDDTQTERRAEVNHAQWRAAMKLHGRPKGAPRSTHEGGGCCGWAANWMRRWGQRGVRILIFVGGGGQNGRRRWSSAQRRTGAHEEG